MTRLVVDDSSICFINCHLAAGQEHSAARNADLAAIFENKDAFGEKHKAKNGYGSTVDAVRGEKDRVPDPTAAAVAFVNGGDGSMVLDHEIVFVSRALDVACETAC
jgi:hypothetical protein